MKTQEKFSRSLIVVAAITVLILMVPLIAMQFTDDVQWSFSDFVIMGALIFGTGITFKLITRGSSNITFKIAAAFAFGASFLMIWVNLAVGLIGSGPNAGNLMYMVVPAAAVIGALLSNFTPGGMERAMYLATLLLVFVTALAFLANMDEYPGSSARDILAVSGFFGMLFIISGLLFRYAARRLPDAEIRK